VLYTEMFVLQTKIKGPVFFMTYSAHNEYKY